jgi:hypothetical protein
MELQGKIIRPLAYYDNPGTKLTVSFADLNGYGTEISELQSEHATLCFNVKSSSYGATGDNSTNDTRAIRDAITAAAAVATSAYHPVLYFPACVGYYTSGTITIPKNIDVIMDAPIIYHGTDEEPALVVGEAGVASMFVTLKLNVKRNTISDWTSENNIGIFLYNCNTCKIDIVQAYGFTIGVQCIGDGQGFAYNTTRLGYIISNKYGVDLNNDNSGWCNENYFYGGRFAVGTGVNSTESRYGVRITSKEDYYNNSNVFMKPSFELNSTDASDEAVCILIEKGMNNSFLKIRNENNDSVATIENNSTENEITTGYGYAPYTESSVYPYNNVESIRQVLMNKIKSIVFNSGAMHKNAVYYNNSSYVHIPNVHFSYGTVSTLYETSDNITIYDSFLNVAARGIGVFINTELSKRFIVYKDVVSGYGGRLSVRCYDENGDILTNLDAEHPYVKGTVGISFTWSTTYGGTYRTGADTNSAIYFKVGDAVKYIDVIVSSGTLNLRIRQFQIATLDDYSCAAWSGYEGGMLGASLATVSPTKGKYEVRKLILNAVPSSGNPQGWVCIRRGTTAANGGEPAAEVNLAVDDVGTATDGDVVGVVLDNGVWHWTTINGAPGGGVIVLLAGVPAGRTVPDDAEVIYFKFNALANLA